MRPTTRAPDLRVLLAESAIGRLQLGKSISRYNAMAMLPLSIRSSSEHVSSSHYGVLMGSPLIARRSTGLRQSVGGGWSLS